MDELMNLSNMPDDDGNVDIIANRTKNNYVNLQGANSGDVIDCVYHFLCKHNVWDIKDNVVHTKKPTNYIPDPRLYRDISFVLTFYNLVSASKDEKRTEKSITHKSSLKNLLSIFNFNVTR